MNLELTIDETEADVDDEEDQEQTVCARLIFTKEQVTIFIQFCPFRFQQIRCFEIIINYYFRNKRNKLK